MEYRPCIVTETIYPCSGTQGMLKNKKHEAVFHCWTERQRFYQQPFSGIYTQPNFMNQTIAIVEYEDGTIHEHLPQEIQFTDGMVEKISKNKKDGWNKLTEDTDSYPEAYENVLFRTSDGRIYYGYFNVMLIWGIDIENEKFYEIKDVVEWKKVKL